MSRVKSADTRNKRATDEERGNEEITSRRQIGRDSPVKRSDNIPPLHSSASLSTC